MRCFSGQEEGAFAQLIGSCQAPKSAHADGSKILLSDWMESIAGLFPDVVNCSQPSPLHTHTFIFNLPCRRILIPRHSQINYLTPQKSLAM
ncbi:hypothetical protein VFPPC_09442 [Pochonia chlamydosporia 170]|uniref:Uncharacterized protein n=1 Tax=Pochonia chlamydosporia 170 TaxID=1380566 RepID=A0A179F938_METCM|nr:hypothetical protein VFPPC_09442 [Pochonia chlamydosporia 170]OAQ61629.1 hypothetical protein VFPPC_09442 [Pochonia chlamydosporia 170]